MENSILYGFRNPAMAEDIGMTMVERQYPTTITPLGYTPGNVTNRSSYYDHIYNDTFELNGGIPESKRNKEYSAFKKILVGLGLVALGVLGYKKGWKGIKAGYEWTKNHLSDLYTKSKAGIINLYNKVKTKISP